MRSTVLFLSFLLQFGPPSKLCQIILWKLPDLEKCELRYRQMDRH